MKIVTKNSRELFVLIAGIGLLLGGVIGMLIVMNTNNQDHAIPTTNPMTLTAEYQQSLVIPAKNSPTPVPDVTETSATIEPMAAPETLRFNLYFVHASQASGLENPLIPDRIVIPEIDLDAPVVIADFNSTNVDGETFGQWQAPSSFAAGWQPDSAPLGRAGNTVINGHHNEYGEVFGRLVDLKIGDKVYVYSQGKKFGFIIANRMILMERFVDTATRLENARWLARTDDVRLTLVTCWPKLSNTHRLILVARPLD